jgi:hypothetical protein
VTKSVNLAGVLWTRCNLPIPSGSCGCTALLSLVYSVFFRTPALILSVSLLLLLLLNWDSVVNVQSLSGSFHWWNGVQLSGLFPLGASPVSRSPTFCLCFSGSILVIIIALLFFDLFFSGGDSGLARTLHAISSFLNSLQRHLGLRARSALGFATPRSSAA